MRLLTDIRYVLRFASFLEYLWKSVNIIIYLCTL